MGPRCSDFVTPSNCGAAWNIGRPTDDDGNAVGWLLSTCEPFHTCPTEIGCMLMENRSGRWALRFYMQPKVDGAHAMDGQLLEAGGAAKRLWQIDVVGILWSPDITTKRLAIVESPQSTWSLPRGRVCAGELHADAFPGALRLSSDRLNACQVLHLEHDASNLEAPIRVYWTARFQQARLPGEDGSLRWVSPKKAAKRLVDPHDLRALSAYMTANSSFLGMEAKAAAIKWFHRIFISPKRIRLIGELRRTETRLSAYQLKGKWGASYQAALSFFSKALTAFYQHDFEGSWKCLSEVRRLELAIMEPMELAAERILIEEEGRTKLNGWRSAAFKRMMKEADKEETPEHLDRALSLISDSQDTRFYNISLMRMQANLMACLLIMISVLFLVFSVQLTGLQKPLPESGDLGGNHYWTILVSAFLLGSMGACVSALMSFSQPQILRVPDRMMDFIITLVRPVIGGASALVSTFFFLSGIIHGDKFNLAFLFVVAFAFGFSERLVMRSVSRVEPK